MEKTNDLRESIRNSHSVLLFRGGETTESTTNHVNTISAVKSDQVLFRAIIENTASNLRGRSCF